MVIQALLKKIVLSIRASTYSNENESTTEIENNLGNMFIFLNRFDYKELQRNISLISHELHEEGTDCVPFLMKVFLDRLHFINGEKIKNNAPSTENVDIINFEDIYMNILDNFKDDKIRFSEFKIPIKIENKEGFYSQIRQLLSFQSENPIDDTDINSDIFSRMMAYSIARALANDLGYTNEVYMALNNYIQQINRASYFQLARDSCEEILLTSIIDNHKPYGLMIYLNCFVVQKNIIDSLIYGNILLFSLIDTAEINKDIYHEVIFIIFTFFRNFKFFDIAEDIYKNILLNLDLGEYEKQKVENAYLYIFILKADKESLDKISDYFKSNIERILDYGLHSITPSYNLLLNAKKIEGYSLTELPIYENILSKALGKDKVNNTFVLDENENDIKNKLIRQLNKLSRTRNKADLVSESNLVRITANISYRQSLKNNDADLFLLSHYLHSDLSLSFELSEAPKNDLIDSKFNTTIQNVNKFENYTQEVVSVCKEFSDDVFIWLASVDGDILYVSLNNSTFSQVKKLPSCSFLDIVSWGNDVLPSFGFEDSKKIDGSPYTYEYFPEDFKNQECNKIFQELPSLLVSQGQAKRVFVFMTNEMSIFPANLLKMSENTLLASQSPITVPLSFDNFTNSLSSKVNVEKLYLWSPVTEGDYAINMAYSKVQDALSDYNIYYDEGLIPDQKNQADINMFIAHGSSGGEGLRGLYASDTTCYIADTIRIFGTGKVAILFICHSGSSGKSLFFNKANSIIKKLIGSHYEAVIAPAWSLNVLIPGAWSHEFFNSINNGHYIDRAVYDANMKIKNKFFLPNAWACMHLYGNNDIKICPKN